MNTIQFDYSRTNFVENLTYTQITHADALQGIPNFVTQGLELDKVNKTISSGIGINGGTPFAIGLIGEKKPVTLTYKYIYVYSKLQGSSSYTRIVESDEELLTSGINRYFKIYDLVNNNDLRFSAYVKNVSFESVGDGEFVFNINGTKTPPFTASVIQNAYSKEDSDQRYVNITGDAMSGNLSTKELTVTKITNSGVTNLNSTVNVTGTMNAQSIEATRLDSNGGGIYASGGNYDGQGGTVYAHAFGIEAADGAGVTTAIRWKDSNSIDVFKNMYLGNKTLFAGSGGININNNTTFNSGGQMIMGGSSTQQIIMNGIPDNTSRQIRLVHENGNTAGDLIWDRTSGASVLRFRLLSVLTGVPFCGITMRENQKVYNEATNKYLTESATLLFAQVQSLENQVAAQETIEMQQQQINLLQAQVTAIADGTDVPTALPQARTKKGQSTLDLLKEQLFAAEEELHEQLFQDEVTAVNGYIEAIEQAIEERVQEQLTVISSQIEAIEQVIEEESTAVNVKAAKPAAEAKKRKELLQALKSKYQAISDGSAKPTEDVQEKIDLLEQIKEQKNEVLKKYGKEE